MKQREARSLLSFTCAAGVVAGWGCAQSPRQTTEGSNPSTEVARETPAESWTELHSALGTYIVHFASQPATIPLNEPFVMTVRVYESDTGRAAAETSLDVDGRMPQHRHGMNTTPHVSWRGQGVFEVSGMLFHMPGRWQLHFDVTRDGHTERAQFEVMLD